jgi:hypothetical protein
MRDAYEPLYPVWQIELLDITRLLLTEFCRRYDHRLPEQYPHLPWDRARAYLRAFPEIAPVRA